MGIFGPGAAENDQAVDEISSLLYIISERLETQLGLMESDDRPEQAALALIKAIRMLCDEFPLSAKIMMERKALAKWKKRFFSWYENRKDNMPKQFVEDIRISAETEFSLLEKII